ncbi:MAG: metal-binding protein [Roseivirga sp.]|nr:metal-binding protein [Roseivirga sp.]
MIRHIDLAKDQLHQLIRSGKITLGGNKNLKIYGLLSCKSGKRMLRKNRAFFETEAEALDQGYRPCGHCMRAAYKIWKRGEPVV